MATPRRADDRPTVRAFARRQPDEEALTRDDTDTAVAGFDNPRSEAYRWFARGLGFAVGVLVVLVVVMAAAMAVRALILVFAAILLGSALEPIVGALRSRLPLGRGASLLLVYGCLFAIFVGVALLVVPTAIGEADQLGRELPAFLDRARGWAAGLHPQPLAQSVSALIDSARNATAAGHPPSPQAVVEVGLTVGQAAVFAGTLLAIVFFWLTERARLQRYALAFVSPERRPGARDAWNEIETRLGLWVRGQLLLMAAMAVMTGIVYTIIGLPSSLLLAVWAGVAEAIPLVGPLLGAVPAVLLAATVRPELVVITLVVYGCLQFIEGNVLVPVIMRNTIGISPFLVIVSLSIGAEIGGIPGAFLAVPVTAAIEVVLERLQDREVPVMQDPGASPAAEEREQMAEGGPDGPGGPGK